MAAQGQTDKQHPDEDNSKTVQASPSSATNAACGPFQANQIIDKTYRIISLIGEGGAGQVYRAEHIVLKKEMALKLLTLSNIDTSAWTRFQHEAQIIGKLSHEGIVKVYNFGIHEGVIPYYAMEVMEGESLAKSIKKFGAFSIAEAMTLFLDITEALKYAHDKGIVHRDIKPDNIFLARSTSPLGYQAKLLDFGIAKLQAKSDGEGQRLTQLGQVMGSPLYMSPEQCKGLDTDRRSDIYSLGCTIFETITGEPPFKGNNVMATVMMHCEAKPRLLSECSNQNVPSRLTELVDRCLQKDPDRRYQSMDEVIMDLIWINQNLKHTSRTLEKRPARLEHLNMDTGLSEQEKAKRNRIQTITAVATACAITLLFFFVLKPLEVRKSPKAFSPDTRELAGRLADPPPKAQPAATMAKSYLVRCSYEGKLLARHYDFSDTDDIGDFVIARLSGKSETLHNPKTFTIYGLETASFTPSRSFCQTPINFRRFDPGLPNALYMSGTVYMDLPLADCLKDLDHIQGLHFIDLADDDITNADLLSLKKLRGLTGLNLNRTYVTLEQLADCQFIDSLEDLRVRRCKGNPIQLFDRLARSRKIKTMDLIEIPLSATEARQLGNLKSLDDLSIGREPYGKAHIEALLSLPRLNKLYIHDADMDKDFRRLLKKLCHLKYLIFTTRKGWTETEIADLRRVLPTTEVQFPEDKRKGDDSTLLEQLQQDYKDPHGKKLLGL